MPGAHKRRKLKPFGRGLMLAITVSKGIFHVNAPALQIIIPERFDKAVKLIRSALADRELSVAAEFETTADFEPEPGKKAGRSRILLVDCPLSVFEAQVLDRAAAVFLPLHILVSARGDQTLISTLSSAVLLDARLPLGVAGPMEKLQARVTLAVESVLATTAANEKRRGE